MEYCHVSDNVFSGSYGNVTYVSSTLKVFGLTISCTPFLEIRCSNSILNATGLQ